MHELIKFWDDNWWWLIFVGEGAFEWIGEKFGIGAVAWSKRRRRKIKYKQRLREIEIKRRKLELEATHPKPVVPICGCEHHMSFHRGKANECHYQSTDDAGALVFQCRCQQYVGPEPLPTYYLDPLADLDNIHPEGGEE